VEETKRGAIEFRKRRPVGSRFFEQAEGAVDVGADEIVGPWMERSTWLSAAK